MKTERRAAWTALIAAAAAGSLFALSFVATPVKFLAPDVPLAHLLAVGRVTFRASLGVECFLLACLLVIASGRSRWLVWGAIGALAVQWLAIMPELDARTVARMRASSTAPSSLHHWWIALDLLRLGLYLAIMLAARRAPPGGPTAQGGPRSRDI